MATRDRPWLMRTYSGHSSARASNELYRTNLAKGQTGLSVAFDLPTQTGYDPDHVLARGEVGKVGVPVPHLGEMRTLFDGIPLDEMNTSMTINATAMWLLGMYSALAEEQGVDPTQLGGTTQNDIVKEYLSRGTYIFPPEASQRLTVDLIVHTVRARPALEPDQRLPVPPPGGGRDAGAGARVRARHRDRVLDAVRESGQVARGRVPRGRRPHLVLRRRRASASSRRCARCARSPRMWDRITLERYGVQDEKLRRFRYGVQVNSLGLTEAQPENNVQRIVLEMLGVTLSKDARARAIQLPCWNEALGLPRRGTSSGRCGCSRCSRYETDLLEYDDLFEGSKVDRGEDRRARRGGRGRARSGCSTAAARSR